jgi:predicted DCC family thiol-disulfide oxidoreductase YuxK
MVSLISEITDRKGRRASAGWIFYDAGCPFCAAAARRLARIIEPRGFGLAPLQDARVQALLNLPEQELMAEMHLLLPDGRRLGGADALIRLCRDVWWAWPLYALAKAPGVMALLRARYRAFAARRACANRNCELAPIADQSSVSSGMRR